MGKMERSGKAGGVSEQRFVVEITRPVPPDKVATVAARIAGRLRLDLERIHTLLDGRVGPVTRPVLADKADSIAEVFAEAGVRVIVVGAPSSVTAASVDPEPSDPDLAAEAAPAVTEPSADQPAAPERTGTARTEPARTWDPATAWDNAASDIDQWQPAQVEQGRGRVIETAGSDEADRSSDAEDHDIDQSSHMSEVGRGPRSRGAATTPRVDTTHHASDHGANQPDPARADQPDVDDDEDEADRLGPTSSRTTPERLFTTSTSTRWVPSPHDAYGFDADEEPYVPAAEEGERGAGTGQGDNLEPHGYEAPQWRGGQPRRAPALRTYLLWSLAASLLVLILLQVVFAARGLAGSDPLDYNVGLRAYQQGDFAKAKRIWEPLASEGEPHAQYQLGFMAQHGLGQPWSNARAANHYRRAAEAGLPEAQLALGELYLRGMGVEQDAQIAAQWYLRAAQAGHAEAQYQYALLVLHGEGVAQQFDTALAWFEAAAVGGVARAADLVAFVSAAPSPSQH